VMRGSVVGMRPAGLIADDFAPETPQSGDRFGAAVAIGDLGGPAPTDAYADLAIGIPGQNVGSHPGAGRVEVIYSDHSDPWLAAQSLNANDTVGSIETQAGFGTSLATGHTGTQTYGTRSMLLVGVPGADEPGSSGVATDAGAIGAYWSGFALLADGYRGVSAYGAFTQAESGDRFGTAIAAADVDGAYGTDLIAGIPSEDVGSTVDGGAVQISRSPLDVTKRTTQVITQNSPGVPGSVETGDGFGFAVAG
jgi:hypothetical protein